MCLKAGTHNYKQQFISIVKRSLRIMTWARPDCNTHHRQISLNYGIFWYLTATLTERNKSCRNLAPLEKTQPLSGICCRHEGLWRLKGWEGHGIVWNPGNNEQVSNTGGRELLLPHTKQHWQTGHKSFTQVQRQQNLIKVSKQEA